MVALVVFVTVVGALVVTEAALTGLLFDAIVDRRVVRMRAFAVLAGLDALLFLLVPGAALADTETGSGRYGLDKLDLVSDFLSCDGDVYILLGWHSSHLLSGILIRTVSRIGPWNYRG